MKAYIHRCATISVLDSLETGILKHVHENYSREVVEPNYKELVPKTHLRRMSKVGRMGVGAALKAMRGMEVGGIIVGTGGGCYTHTILFIEEYFERDEGILSPNSFIQSTDNTISGQIALLTKNNAYNITYIQKGLAFENALVDAMLLSEENKNLPPREGGDYKAGNILVGGVDEWIPYFELSAETKKMHLDYWIGEGASFFMLNHQEKDSLAKISACGMISTDKNSLQEKINSFFKQHQLEAPDLILYGNSFINEEPLSGDILGIKTVNYSNLCGIYFTNSAFAAQLAVEIISNPGLASTKGLKSKNIMVLNNFVDMDWGLTYLSAR